MKKRSLKKGQIRAINAKTLKNVFCFRKIFAVGESLLTLVAEHGSEKP